jgi:PEP-CTERM motif
MKKILAVLALAVALVAVPRIPAYADASQQGCESSGGRAKGCSNTPGNDPVIVPEPGSSVLLVFGLAALGGVAIVLGVRRLSRN